MQSTPISMSRHLNRVARALFPFSLVLLPSVCSAQSYATLARTFADAPLVAHVRAISAVPIKPDPAGGTARFYVVASTMALIRAPSAQPPMLNLLVDLPRDSAGKAPRPKKAEWLIAARADPQVRLTAPPVAWTADNERRVREIVAEASTAGAPGPIVKVAGAFYSPGNIPGESETQIFLDLATGKGSLSILRRPQVTASWSASFGDVAGNAPPPAKDTLAWYRLACGLPAALPETALHDLDDSDQSSVRADYAFVLTQLGACS